VETALHKESKGGCLQLINAAVLGSPIAHSLSPLLHAKAYQLLGIEGIYEAIEVRSGELASFLSSTDKKCLSLTMPLKEEALSLADNSSSLSQRISSGNTLTCADGKWSLTSTDVAGFEYSLKSQQIDALDTVMVLGAGATARAAVSYLSTVAKKIHVVSRNAQREASMNKASDTPIDYLPWEPTSKINEVDLVVNTAPGDAAGSFLSSINSPRGALFEVLYHPWPTELARTWATTDRLVVDGLELLIHQAISQIEIFSGVVLDRTFLHAHLRKAALIQLT
jgi:shikimate dehydrogenase